MSRNYRKGWKTDAHDEGNTSRWQGCRRLGDGEWSFLGYGIAREKMRGVKKI